MQLIGYEFGELSAKSVIAKKDDVEEFVNYKTNEYVNIALTWIDKKAINLNGDERTSDYYKCTDFIDVENIIHNKNIEFNVYIANTNCVAAYDKFKLKKQVWSGLTSSIGLLNKQIVLDDDIKYIRLTTSRDTSYYGEGNLKVYNVTGSVFEVNEKNIKDNSVTISKCDFFVHEDSTNFIDLNNCVSNSIISQGKYITANNWYATGDIKLKPNTKYYYNSVHKSTFQCYYAIYDKDGNILQKCSGRTPGEGETLLTNPFTTPSDTEYGRFSFPSASKNEIWLSLVDQKPNVCNYKMEDSLISSIQISGNNVKDHSLSYEKTTYIDHKEDTNFIDINSLLLGKVPKGNKMISTEDQNWYGIDKIELSPQTKYYHLNLHNKYWSFLDEKGNVVDSGDGTKAITSDYFITPENTKYGMFAINKDYKFNSYISLYDKYPKTYKIEINNDIIPDEKINFNIFNKCLCIGDSFSGGMFDCVDPSDTSKKTTKGFLKYSYPKQLEKLSKVECVSNSRYTSEYGCSLSGWYDANKDQTDLGGYDCVIIELGIHDVGKAGSTEQEMVTYWNNASKPAIDLIIEKLESVNSGSKEGQRINPLHIFFCTTPFTKNRNHNAFIKFNQLLKDYITQLEQQKYNIHFIDLNTITKQIANISELDTLSHYTAFGYLKMAYYIYNEINDIMEKEGEKFKYVQFIGTNYYNT